MSRYFVHLIVFAGLITLASECNKDSIHISWNAGSDIPVGLGWTAASVLDNQIYVSGGISGLLTVNPEYTFTSKTEIGIPEF